jgi:hypothetical protein
MGIKPPDVTQPFPTESMIKRAKSLHIREQEGGRWIVWQSGHDAHLVEKETKFYTCDCTGFRVRNVCSHVAAVRIRLAGADFISWAISSLAESGPFP